MKLSVHFTIVLTFAALLSFNMLNGQAAGDYRSATSGNWNDLSTWERFDGSSWLTPTMGQGTPTNANGLINIKDTHVITVTADVSVDQTTIEVGGEVIVDSGVNLTINNGTGTYDLTVNGRITNSGTIIKATSIIQIGSGGVYDHARDGGAIPSANWNSNATCEVTGKVNNNITGLNQTFGHLKWNSPGQTGNQNLPSTGQIFVSGDFEISDTGTGELRLNQDFLTLIGDFTQTSGHFRMANADNSRIITVNGNFSMSGGALEIASGGGGAMGDGIFELYGDFSFTGGSIEENTGSTGSGYFIFVGAAPQQYAKSGGATFVDNVHFYIASGTEVSFGTSVIDGSTGDFILDPGAQLTTANSGGIPGTILVGGSKTYSSDADYEFQGSNTGVFITTPDANTVNSLIVNAPGGLTLDMPITVNTLCLFVDGVLTTTTTNLLTINNDADGLGASNDSFVTGPVSKIGDDDFTFPIGKSPIGYAPVGISGLTSVTTFQAEYFSGTPVDTMTRAMSIDHLSAIEYWTLSRTSGASNAIVALSWRGSSNVTDPSSLLLARYDGSQWVDHPATTDAMASTITTNSPVTSFSDFTLGSSLPLPTNPLPIELLYFNAAPTDNHVLLEWSTATESDNDFFVVEKTKDGVNFEEVAKIDGAGNSSFILKYQTLDENPYPGKSYYRLQQVDFSGHFSFSELVQVSFESNGFTWNIYPNPVYDQVVNVAFNTPTAAEIELRLVDVTGKVYFRTILTGDAVALPNDLARGAYFLVAASNGEIIGHKPLIIK
jgi:hypothetical protein